VNELGLDQRAALYQRARHGLDRPPDLGVTGPSFPEQIKLIRASTDASGVKGLCSIACGEKSFIYLGSGAFGAWAFTLESGSEALSGVFGELLVDGVEPRADLGVKTVNPSL
jgi:hypothetical protein